MPKYVVDMTDAVPFTGLPAGTYLVAVSKATIGKSKASQEDTFSLEFEVLEPEEAQGKGKLFDHINLKNVNTKGRLQTTAIALGFSKEEATSAKFELDTDNWIGRRATAVVGIVKEGTFAGQARILRLAPEVLYNT